MPQIQSEDYLTADRVISRRSIESNANRRDRETEAKAMLNEGVSVETLNLLTIDRQSISRILYYAKIYEEVVSVPGVICEFGVHYGSTMNILLNLRGIKESYNVSRKLFGFDTFSGFPHIHPDDQNDRNQNLVNKGDNSVYQNHEERLSRLLTINEAESPVSHLKRFELVKGV